MIGKRTHLFGIQIAMNGSPSGAFCGFNSWYLVEVRFVAPSRLVYPWAPSGFRYSSDSASRPALWPSRFQSWVKDFLPAVEEKNIRRSPAYEPQESLGSWLIAIVYDSIWMHMVVYE